MAALTLPGGPGQKTLLFPLSVQCVQMLEYPGNKAGPTLKEHPAIFLPYFHQCGCCGSVGRDNIAPYVCRDLENGGRVSLKRLSPSPTQSKHRKQLEYCG